MNREKCGFIDLIKNEILSSYSTFFLSSAVGSNELGVPEFSTECLIKAIKIILKMKKNKVFSWHFFPTNYCNWY